MRERSRFLAAAALGLFLSACGGAAEAPATDGDRSPTRLGAPAEFPAPFSVIRAVMALPDGRLVVSDPEENRVSLIDFDKGTGTPLGRVGEGPREYMRAAGLYRGPGGGVRLFDHEYRRLLPISPLGALEDVIPASYGGLAGSYPTRPPDDLGFDSLGHTFYKVGGGITDPVRFVLRRRPGMPPDTVARLQAAETRALNARSNGTGSYRQVLFSPEDAWVVAPDGSVAVVRAAPYRVEWFPVEGAGVAGPEIRQKPVPIGREEKRFIASGAGGWRGISTVSLVMVAPGGPASSRPGTPAPIPVSELLFANAKSPVNLRDGRWPLLDESGRLWVERSLPFGEKTSVFDVFDRAGSVVDRVEMPAGSRLVGFDSRWLYAARLDAEAFEHLQRFPLPR